MRQRYYMYKFSNGEIKWLTKDQETQYLKQNPEVKTLHNGYESQMNSFVKSTKDGFKSGWHPGLGMYIRGKKHFAQELNRRGAEEMGREKPNSSNKEINIKFSEEDLRGIREITSSLTDNELTHIGEVGLNGLDVPVEVSSNDPVEGGYVG